MAMNPWAKGGLWLGAGILIGAAGAVLISRNGADLRKGCAKVFSHVTDLKDKAEEVIATAKENLEDIAAEARHESDLRKEKA